MSKNALDKYQDFAKKSADPACSLDSLFIGLSAEVGELHSERMRELRTDREAFGHHEVLSELGDIMWYVANIAGRYGMTLQEVSKYNQEKLIERGNNNGCTIKSK